MIDDGERFAIFSRANAEKMAANYDDFSFIEKPKNLLAVFYLLNLVFAIFVIGFIAITDIEYMLRLACLVAYGVITLFVFFNKQWAMIMGATFFVGISILFLIFTDTLIIRPILFSFICIGVTVRAIFVSDALRKQ